jgi:hypothetical protein
MQKLFVSACLVAMLLGCATIVKGTDQQVALDTPGYPGANCRLSSSFLGVRQAVTPAILTLPKSKHDIAVECQKGCARGSGVIESHTEAMTAGNVLLGGAIGLGVDAASGAMNKYSAQNQVVMSIDPACKG